MTLPIIQPPLSPFLFPNFGFQNSAIFYLICGVAKLFFPQESIALTFTCVVHLYCYKIMVYINYILCAYIYTNFIALWGVWFMEKKSFLVVCG